MISAETLKRVQGKIKRKSLNAWDQWAMPRQLSTIKDDLLGSLDSTLEKSLLYVNSLQQQDKSVRKFSYTTHTNEKLLYSSIFGILFLSLRGELEKFEALDKDEWSKYINSYHCEDGLFRDYMVNNKIAEVEDWWGWRHLTLLTLMALYAIDSKPKLPLKFISKLDSPSKVKKWLSSLNWKEKVSYTSNTVQNYGAAMQYARNFMGESVFQDSIETLLEVVSEHCDPKTGIWGIEDKSHPAVLSEGVQAGYHFWLLYWYEGYDIPFPEQAFNSILKLQNKCGGFNLQSIYSSACEDIDGVLPLIKIALDHPKTCCLEAQKVENCLVWLIHNFNRDGGANFRKNEPFEYGHELMFSDINQSSVFATWFRTLAIAYCCEFLKKKNSAFERYNFQYINCPGLQFPLQKMR